MTKQSQNHWTDDEELLEQYLLGRLPADRKRALDMHLEVCDQCRSAVSSQEELVAGIRRFGREEIKSRLAIRLAEERQRRKNWSRFAGIAAGIFLFFAVGIRDDWFFEMDRHRGDWSDRVDSLRRILQAEQRYRLRQVDDLAGTAPKDEMNGDVKRAAPPVNGAESYKGRYPSDKPKSPGGAAILAVPSEQDARLLSTRSEPYDTVSFWLDGAFVGGSLEKEASSGRDVVSAAGQEAVAHTKGLALMARPNRMQGGQPNPDQFTLVQRPLSEFPLLPAGKRKDPGAVPALLKIVGPRTQLFLFLDSLFTPSQFLAATVETVRPDSIVVSIGGRRIGCKIPPGAIGTEAKDIHKTEKR